MAFVKAVPQIANLFILMFLVMGIFALLGMQTFGGTGLSADSRWHFDYFDNAMLTVFAVFSGAWFDSFMACSELSGEGLAMAWFMPAILVGFFVIINLFVAILLESFAEEDEAESDDGEQAPRVEQRIRDSSPRSPPTPCQTPRPPPLPTPMSHALRQRATRWTWQHWWAWSRRMTMPPPPTSYQPSRASH